MQALRPWSGMAGLKHEMDRLFDRFFEPGWTEMAPMSEWEPKIDLAESKDTITVKAEIPGVEQKDISVSLENGVLTIKGEKQQQKGNETLKALRQEAKAQAKEDKADALEQRQKQAQRVKENA